MRQALVNARVLAPQGWLDDHAVVLDSDRIAALLPLAALRDEVRVDLDGALLAPGFIDCQVNGGGGVLFNEAPAVDSIARIGAAHRRFGTTGFLPTLISDTRETMAAAIAAVDAARRARIPGVLGVHLEGPYLAAARRGVHDAAHFRIPDADEIALATSLRDGVTLLTLAPEQLPPGTIAALSARGARIALGHTAADYETVRAALAAGASGFTHLYNAMSPLTSREPGTVGAALDDAGSWCGLIVDGFHVHPAALRIALAAKPRGKCLLVTDAMPPVGDVRDGFLLGTRRVLCRDGRCTTEDGTLAGSALDMATAVRNTVALLGVDLAEALRMASTYPAEFLGLGASHGRIAPGCAADLVALDAGLQVRATWIAGSRSDAASV